MTRQTKHKTLNLYLGDENYQYIQNLADQNERSKSWIVAKMIERERLKNSPPKAKKKKKKDKPGVDFDNTDWIEGVKSE